MKRWLSPLLMLVSLLGMTACKKSEPTSRDVKVTTGSAPAAVVVDGGAASGSAGSDTAGSAGAAADPWKQQAAPKDPLKAVLFWRAEKDGKTTYLLGTMHMGVDPEARLPQVVWDKLDASKTFAMETDLSDPSLMSKMMRTKGSLKEDLGPDYWAKLEKAVGASLAKTMESMSPAMAGTMMALQHLPKTAPMDGVLLGRAQNQKKSIVYLEPAALQIEVLSKYMGLKALKMMIDMYEDSAAETKRLLDAYVAGDPDALLKVTEKQKADALAHGFTEAEYAEQMNDMLYKRNASWIEPIEKLHTAGDGFVAVGALHLVGPKSVLELLEKRGYKITRVAP